MSLAGRKRVIDAGDTVFLFFGYEKVKAVTVTPGQIVNNEFGCFHHADLVGKPFGYRLTSRGKRTDGWVVALHPTPELWTLALPHRTQILYIADISLIIQHLRVRPGSVVAECGTGSGSLSTSLARSLAPDGHLHTFDFNRERVRLASEEFARHGLGGLVTCRHRDVCGNGFPMIDGGVNAVFLDVPNPWVVIENCKALLRPHGRICSFSPCIEQVQRTCLALAEHAFTEIVTVECLVRNYDVRHSHSFERVDLGDEDVSDVEEELDEYMREYLASAAERREREASGKEEAGAAAPAKEDEEKAAAAGEKRERASSPGGAAPAKKRARTDEEAAEATAALREQKRMMLLRRKLQRKPKRQTKAAVQTRALGATDLGHSGYLTFAVRLPEAMLNMVRLQAEAKEAAARAKAEERTSKRKEASEAADQKAAAEGAQ